MHFAVRKNKWKQNNVQVPINTFKEEYRTHPEKVHRGIWVTLGSPSATEICAGSGADWILIDGEHAPYTNEGIMEHIRAASSFSTPVIGRPVETTAANIKQLLDIGVRNIVLPMVDSAQEAHQAMEAIRYAPAGMRGVGASVARAGNWGRYANYMDEAEDEIFVLLQIESRQALDNFDEILEVEGLDGFFIGPADLGASLGNPPAEELNAIVCETLRKIRAKGLVAGSLAFDPKTAEEYIAAGANFIATTADSTLLVQAVDALFGEPKKPLKA